MTVRFLPIPTPTVRAFQSGALDANGQPPEHHISDGGGNPCRHCLKPIPGGEGMLVLAYRPFDTLHPYAEVGPIFLCAQECDAGGGTALPEILDSPDYILRGYNAENRIVYGTGEVVPVDRILAQAAAKLAGPDVKYLHLRSARNNCFQIRLELEA